MQPNEITLSVDEENDGVGPVNHVFTRFEEHLNRAVYIGPLHSMMARNTLTTYRTFPKISGNFRGVAKSAFKFSTDITVPGVDAETSITAPVIVEVSFSVPVGATAAQTMLYRQRALALLDLDAVMAPLNDSLMV